MFFSTRSSLRLALVLSLSMAAAATSVLAGTVEVRCVTEGGSPLKDVEVFLQALPSGQTESKKSGKDGVAKFKDDSSNDAMSWTDSLTTRVNDARRVASKAVPAISATSTAISN